MSTKANRKVLIDVKPILQILKTTVILLSITLVLPLVTSTAFAAEECNPLLQDDPMDSTPEKIAAAQGNLPEIDEDAIQKGVKVVWYPSAFLLTHMELAVDDVMWTAHGVYSSRMSGSVGAARRLENRMAK
jgi:hypothetical protein